MKRYEPRRNKEATPDFKIQIQQKPKAETILEIRQTKPVEDKRYTGRNFLRLRQSSRKRETTTLSFSPDKFNETREDTLNKYRKI